MDVTTDIDIDFFDRATALTDLKYVLAVQVTDGERRQHGSGVYFHNIPTDPLDGMAVWDYEVAETKGYFKLDFLNNTIYKDVRDEAHLVDLMTTEPLWQAFDDPDIVSQLAHVSRHFNVVQTIRPRSIEDLAVCIALVRPGKTHLIGKPRWMIDREIWTKTDKDKYHFKKSHSFAYAVSIIVQLNLLTEQALNE